MNAGLKDMLNLASTVGAATGIGGLLFIALVMAAARLHCEVESWLPRLVDILLRLQEKPSLEREPLPRESGIQLALCLGIHLKHDATASATRHVISHW